LLLLEQKQPAEAIPALQAALRAKPSDATTWEALGAAYQPLGRLTAALKAYTRSIELDPNRIYSLIQKGNLLLSLGDPSKALFCHESALKLDSTHPAALLGAAEALTSSAGRYIHSGAVKAAGMDLEKAAKLAHLCARKNGNLISAWKQLGDILLLARNAPFPSLKTSSTLFFTTPGTTTTPLAEAPAVVVVQEWQQRIVAVQESRKAFTKVLLLNPCASSAWHDVACTYYHESQLYRVHPSILRDEDSSSSRASSNAEDKLKNLLKKAEWCLRGALRLDPASSELWTALGIAATDRAVKEYALSRSLQLDPKSSTAWVALARLYIDAHEPALAEKCLQQGRSQDPAVGLIWEAMAALAALSAATSPAAEKERIDYNQHAVGLGASAEGLLGFAEASLLTVDSSTSNTSISGSFYAAAHRAKELNPLNPAALNVWGLACEVKQDFWGSIKAYTACLELLSLSNDSTPNDGSSNNILLHQHPETTRSGTPLIAGVKLNLARTLCSVENYSSAIALYRELEVEGVLHSQLSALLSYAISKACTGDFNGAEITARSILATSDDCNIDGSIAAAAVEILLQVKIAAGQPASQIVSLLQEHSHQLNDLDAPIKEMKKLWMMAVAAVVVAEENKSTNLIDQTIAAAKHWAMSIAKDEGNAPFFAQLHAQRQLTSISNLAKAVHVDPSALDLRLSLAAAVSTGGDDGIKNYAASVIRLLQNMNIHSATTNSAPESLLTTRLQIATAALLERGLSAGLLQIKKEARAAAQALHTQPNSLSLWYMSALLASQVAAGEKTPGGFRKALTCARCALTLISSSSQGKAEDAKKSDAMLLQQVRLLICISESLLHLPSGDEGKEEALQTAIAAVDNSSKLSSSSSFPVSSTAKADALRQVARCHWKGGDISQAETFYRQAMESAVSPSSNISGAIASMELAACLRSCGRGRDAAEVLHEEASRCTSDLSAGSTCLKTNMLQQILLQRTLILTHIGELDAAKSCAEDATPEEQGSSLQSSSSSMSSSRGLGLVAQGAVALQQALAAGTDTETGVAFLAAARRYLTESLQIGQDGVVPRALLAQVEFSGSNRKKEEKVRVHAEHALLYTDRPVSGELLQFLGKLQGSKALCAKALHSAPWKVNWWAQMQESR